jgi:hypothetical protein
VSFYSASEELPQGGFGNDELLPESDVTDSLRLQRRIDGVTSDGEILDKVLGGVRISGSSAKRKAFVTAIAIKSSSLFWIRLGFDWQH